MDGIAALASSPGTELLDRLSTIENENCKLREGTTAAFYNKLIRNLKTN
jgi:hypothetical protein